MFANDLHNPHVISSAKGVGWKDSSSTPLLREICDCLFDLLDRRDWRDAEGNRSGGSGDFAEAKEGSHVWCGFRIENHPRAIDVGSNLFQQLNPFAGH